MSNDKNKTQLISILLDKLTTDKYTTGLVDRVLSHVLDKEVLRHTCEDARLFPTIQEESNACTMNILYYLNLRI